MEWMGMKMWVLLAPSDPQVRQVPLYMNPPTMAQIDMPTYDDDDIEYNRISTGHGELYQWIKWMEDIFKDNILIDVIILW